MSVKFKVLASSDALGQVRNRSAVVELPMAGASSLVRQHAYPCRKNTPAQPAFPYIFSSALRAAGRSMEAALRSWARHSDTVNMLSKLRSCLVFGTGRGRPAAPRL